MSEGKPWNETQVKKEVTHHIEFRGRLFLIEHVPARVDTETEERHFSPETVEHLHEIVRAGRLPVHTVETPVYEYEAALRGS